jgi:hypothetical protein
MDMVINIARFLYLKLEERNKSGAAKLENCESMSDISMTDEFKSKKVSGTASPRSPPSLKPKKRTPKVIDPNAPKR